MATPPSPVDSDTVLANQQIKDGIISGVLGSLAMVARLLLSTEKVTFWWVVRRILAASITACFVGYAIDDKINSVSLKMAIIGAFGYASPESLDYLLKIIHARGKQELAKYEKPKRRKAGRKSR